MHAKLRRWSWLRRALEVRTDEGWFLVEYDGLGFGYESVWVNGERVATAVVWWSLVAPRIDFRLGPRPAAVEVRVWPWMTMRSFRLSVGYAVLYAEGWATPELPEGWQARADGPAFQPLSERDYRIQANRAGLREGHDRRRE